MKYKVLTLASAAAMLAACSDTSISDGNDQIKDGATVVITAMDNRTNLPLEDVSVYYRHDDKTKETDSAGTVIFKNVAIGDQYFDLYKEGYAFKRIVRKISDIIQNDVARVEDFNEEHKMYENGVSVSGQFFYEDKEDADNWKPAAGVTIYVKYDDKDIYPNEVYTTTDSLGNYSFENLASAGFSLNSEGFVLASDSSKVYGPVSGIQNVKEFKGVHKDIKPEAASLVTLEPVLLSTNLKEIPAKEAIKLVFSEVLYKDSVSTNNIYVENGVGNLVAVSLSLSEDGKTVTVKPTSGSWVDGDQYTLYYDVWSTNHVEMVGSKNKDFVVGKLAVPGQVKGLKIKMTDTDEPEEMISYYFYDNYNYKSEVEGKSDLTYDEQITIEWNSIEKNVDGYIVYVKGNGEKDLDYTYIGSTSSNLDTTLSFNLSSFVYNSALAYPLLKKETQKVSVIVLPYNNAGEAVASGAKALSIEVGNKAKAEITKYIENEYLSNASYDAENGGTFYACSDKSTTSCVYATSPTDFSDGEYYRANIRFTWSTVDVGDYDGPAVDGFDLYIQNGEEWDFIASVGNATFAYTLSYYEEESPFYQKVLPYKASANKNYKFAVVPYFNTVGGKVSQVDLDAAKGVQTVTANLKNAIEKL